MLHCYLLVVLAVFRCLLFCNSRIEFRISLCSNEEYIKGVVIFVMKIKGKINENSLNLFWSSISRQ